MAGPKPEYLFDADYDALVDREERLILLDFTADWCQPCIAMQPTLEEVAVEYAETVLVAKIDLDYSPGIVDRFNVMSVPSFVLLRNGKPVERLRGALSGQQMRNLLDRWVSSTAE